MSKPRYYDDSPVFSVGPFSVWRESTAKDRRRWKVEGHPRSGNLVLTEVEAEDLADALDEALAWAEVEEDGQVSGG